MGLLDEEESVTAVCVTLPVTGIYMYVTKLL